MLMRNNLGKLSSIDEFNTDNSQQFLILSKERKLSTERSNSKSFHSSNWSISDTEGHSMIAKVSGKE